MARNFKLGDWLIRPDLNRVSREGQQPLQIESKFMDVLVCLARHPGEVLSKERLIQTVWSDTFVSDDVLVRAISELRKVFGDDPKNPSVILTVPRKGYCLIAPVSEVGEQDFETAGSPEGPPPAGVHRKNRQPTHPKSLPEKQMAELSSHEKGRTRWPLVTRAGAGIVIGLIAIWWYSFSWDTAGDVEPVILPFTSEPGREVYPRFSPDGSMLAYVKLLDQERTEIRVRRLDGRHSIPVTQGTAWDITPAWSPNGEQIAFLRIGREESGIYAAEPLGGSERKLASLKYPDRPTQMMCNINWGLSWSSKGRYLVFPERTGTDEPLRLRLLDLKTRQKSFLTSPPAHLSDGAPQFSPDGARVAFRRGWDVYLVDVSSGEPIQLTREHLVEGDLAWTADGDELLFTSLQGSTLGTAALWRVSISGGIPQRIWAPGHGVLYPTTSTDGNRLAYAKTTGNFDIFKLELTGGKSGTPPLPIVDSTVADCTPAISPQGDQIAFASERTGRMQIWVCDSDGSNQVQLTSLSGFDTSSPSWSPDGERLAFTSNEKGDYDIYVMDAQGGSPRRLTAHPAVDSGGSWSRDGRWIYFHSNRKETFQIWKMPAAGTEAEAERITNDGGMSPEESWDGEYLYYFKPYEPSGPDAERYARETGVSSLGAGAIWRMPVKGGQKVRIMDSVVRPSAWTLTSRGIYVIDAYTRPVPSIRYRDFESGQESQVAVLPENASFYGGNWISVSPTDDWLVYWDINMAEDIMLLENFR